MAQRMIGTVKRTSGLGGSDIAAMCGLTKYKTPLQLYMEKRGELIEDQEDSTRLRFGRRLEKPVADEFAYVTGRKVWRERVTQRHPEHKQFLANIDRWQLKDDHIGIGTNGTKGVYEGKTADWTQRPLWTQGGVPDMYYLQLQWYLYVTGCSFGSYGVLFGLGDFHFFDVDRDDNTIATIEGLALDFWRRVQEGEPPDWTFGEAGANLAKRLYAKATPKKAIVFEGVEAEVKIRRLLQLKQAIKTRETEEKDLTTWLQTQMQDAEIGTFHGLAKIAWPNQSRRSIDLEALKSKYSAIAEELTVIKESRRFTITAVDPQAIEEDKTPDSPMIITSGVRAIELD